MIVQYTMQEGGKWESISLSGMEIANLVDHGILARIDLIKEYSFAPRFPVAIKFGNIIKDFVLLKKGYFPWRISISPRIDFST